MKENSHNRSLLTELIVVLVLFTFCAVILAGVFSTAYQLGIRASQRDEALYAAQNLADVFWTQGDFTALLTEEGYLEAESNLWVKESEHYQMQIRCWQEDTLAGCLLCTEIKAVSGDDCWFTLPASFYRLAEEAK